MVVARTKVWAMQTNAQEAARRAWDVRVRQYSVESRGMRNARCDCIELYIDDKMQVLYRCLVHRDLQKVMRNACAQTNPFFFFGNQKDPEIGSQRLVSFTVG